MKILFITPYVTISGYPEFMRNKTGFGYMVYDIAKAIARLKHVEVLATDSRGKGFVNEGVHYLQRSLLLMLRYWNCCTSVNDFWHFLKRYNPSKGAYVRLWYYWLLTGYLHQLIRKGNYDVVHIHGCAFSTELWIQLCESIGQKYIVTLHGFDSFSDTVNLEPAGKYYERVFLQRGANGNIPITVISTGMKKIIEKEYHVCNLLNVSVVCNSFSFDLVDYTKSIDIRTKYKISKEAKILLYVGNVGRNKNQIQMVAAYTLLPEKLRNMVYVLFCGLPSDEVDLKQMIEESGYASHLIMCGGIDKYEMQNFYKTANGVVLLSFSEGFGLSLIEGMHFGLPCMLFNDMDAFEDIFDENVAIGIERGSDQIVANGLERLLSEKWDKTLIKEYSKKFESNEMANRYIAVYKKILKK